MILLFNADDDGDDDHDYRGDCGYHDCDDDDSILIVSFIISLDINVYYDDLFKEYKL